MTLGRYFAESCISISNGLNIFKGAGNIMNIRRSISAAISIVFIAAFVLVGYDSASGQGRYTARYSKRDVSGTISKLEQSSNSFRSDFDRAMDNSNLNGTPSEDRFNNLVRDFENSVDRLRREFDRGDVWWQSRNLVENMIRDARPVNNMMTTLPFRRNLERRWNQLRKDINVLADTYDLAGLDGGGWNGGGGGGNTSTPPNWARGTFYSTNGSGTTLTINQNGTVSAYVNGQTYYGTYYRNEMTLNNDVSTVTRDGDGIRTYNRNSGQTTNYSRTNNGGGSGGGNTSTPPNWARGTFYSTNGSGTTLTINQNGTVSAYVNGQTYYGTYYRNEMTLNNDVSTVTRDGDGIRTYNRNSGQTTNYSRTDNGGGNSGGGNTSTPPNWARGTFYSTNGSGIQLTINSNGSVTANVGGQTYYGTYYEGSITLNNDTSTVSRDGDGIKTYNRSTGQTTNYRRN